LLQLVAQAAFDLLLGKNERCYSEKKRDQTLRSAR